MYWGWRACAYVQVFRVHGVEGVVCIGSDFVENVFSVRLVGLGGRRGPGNVDDVHRSKVATGRWEPLPDGSMSPIGNNPA